MDAITPLVGIFPNIPEEKYHVSPGVSQSQLKLLGEEGGPARFRYGERRETRPQKLGTLTHSLILQPHTVNQRYCVTQLMREGTKEWEKEKIEADGRIMVKQVDFDKARNIADAVFRWSSVARELLTSPDRVSVENSFYWVDPSANILCRGRADSAHDDYRVLIDIKTARSASTDGFRRAVREYSYHVQAAWYLDGWPLAGGWNPVDFIFIVVQSDPPYLTANYVLDKDDLQDARNEIHRLMDIYQQCSERDEWPGFDEGVIDLPPLYKARYDV